MKKKSASYSTSDASASPASCPTEKTISTLAALDKEVAALLVEATHLVDLFHIWSSPEYVELGRRCVEWFTLSQDLHAVYTQLRDHGVTLHYVLVRSDAAKERSHAH